MKNEYFIQDLYVARRIKNSCPIKHVDIGSRIDGFVAIVACFMEIHILDIRKLLNNFEGITFYQLDLLNDFEIERYIKKMDLQNHYHACIQLNILD